MIYKAVLKRHDFVHRNGKDKNGNLVVANKKMIQKLIEDVRTFIEEIDVQINE